VHDFPYNHLPHCSITHYYGTGSFSTVKKGQHIPRINVEWFVCKLATINKSKQMGSSILLHHKRESTVTLFKSNQYQRQTTINSDKMKVSQIVCTNILFFFCDTATHSGSQPPHSWGFLDHTQRRTTIGRTSLDEWSARRRDLYLTTHNTHNRQISMPPRRIRTHDLSRRAAADLHLRSRGHWDRHKYTVTQIN
jgi:hypothetical protein